MSACAMLSYNNVTAAAFDCCKAAAAKYGVTINSNSGSGTKDGFTVAWNYNPSLQTLSIQCTDSPWWAPCSMINGRINDAVEGCLTSNQVNLSQMTDG
jgi:hypothetical protein